MKIGDTGYIIATGIVSTVEKVQVIDEKESVGRFGEKVPYWKIKHLESIGVSGVPKSMIYETKSEAEKVLADKEEKELQAFAENIIPTKQDLMVFLYVNTAWKLECDKQREHLVKEIKRQTGVDVLKA